MPGDNIRLLALDGGGVRGLSALMILQQLLLIVDPESPPKPCDYFDMIGGTSTGGLIAIMLGRLQMTVDDCISAYASLSDEVFEKKTHRVNLKGKLQGRFDANELERAIKKVLIDCKFKEDTLLRASPDAPCKVFVCATSKETGDTVCLTSYPSPRGAPHLFSTTKIWQACRATSAATSFFDPIAIGPYDQEFVDGALGANNPIFELWSQAQDLWGPQLEAKLKCIVSIGTGVPSVKPVCDDVLGIWKTLKNIAVQTEATAERFHRDKAILHDQGRYYRFNVGHGLEDIGLEESKKKEIASATGRYISSQDVSRRMRACADKLASHGQDIPERTAPTGQPVIHGQVSSNPQFLVQYTSNPDFVGRYEILEQLKTQLGHGQPRAGVTAQYRAALHGLGGIGKTQIALAYVYWLRETYSDISVFWVHASSAERFREAYTSIAQACRIPGCDDPDADVLSLVMKWLKGKDSGRWLMVIDNADDTELFFSRTAEPAGASTSDQEGNLGRYIPECAHGSILVTTRNLQAGSRLIKGKRPIEVTPMDEDESGSLLRARLEGEDLDPEDLSTLCSQLEYLPLALAQAAAFIQENCIPVSEYIQLLGKNDQLVDLLSEEFEAVGRDSGTSHAVTETWILSFEQIQKQDRLASELLSLMSFFDRQAIPSEFLSYYSKKQVPESGGSILLTKALGVLKAFSFIIGDKADSFTMHRLVQLITRKWLARSNTMSYFAGQALLAVSHSYPFGKFETRMICGAYLAHVYAVVDSDDTGSKDENMARARLLHNTAGFLDYQGQWSAAEGLQLKAKDLLTSLLGEDHPDTMAAMSNLAEIYRDQGRWEEAGLRWYTWNKAERRRRSH
ncbi:uncharacterized protein DNG_05042 [Cephalotrichum gorgonifer]|uniref:PNPLA domain-containing protein n=1 Tax=Cephalotrichum gorgonifer TaxID=2041049 RepID=A0AAE8SVF4_9PEZI|nr:uncharacterized protein DNG_05042 [Cephalotrichum gorgonifer]